MTDQLMKLVDTDNFAQLFRKLGWSKPDAPREFETHGVHLEKVATYRGLSVWVSNQLPSRPEQRLVDTALAKVSAERLLIFTDGKVQDWRWPRHSKLGSVNAKLMAHRHEAGIPDPDLSERLQAMKIGIDDSPSLPALVERMRVVFDRESETASSRAARLMGRLYEDLAKAGMETSQATQLLGRLLFLWFGDDTDMWRKDAFHNWLAEHTNPRNLPTKLEELFQALNDPSLDRSNGTLSESDEFQGLRYINGNLFANHLDIPDLPERFRAQVIEASQFDWSIISPAIFGSMFQTVKDAKARREMGEHYTTEENILKTLRPLFLDELEERLQASWDNKGELTKLHTRLSKIRLLDPACGCGNFLIVAYRELRALELRLISRRRELDRIDGIYKREHQPRLQTEGMEDTVVRMSHFAGIEIEEWPAAIASTAMLLVDHLANQHMAEELGISVVRLPIDDHNRANIRIGNALRTNWETIFHATSNVYIAGNPPFIGHESRSREQAAQLREVWGRKDIGRLDYVTAWYKKAADYYQFALGGQFAFVSTNSIAQGQPVQGLFEPLFKAGWRIFFAHQTFVWTSEAPGMAHVHTVIVGLEKGRRTLPRLFTYPDINSLPVEVAAREINNYLIDGPTIFIPQRRTPLSDLPHTTFGNMPRDGGNLIVEESEYADVAADPLAVKYLRPFKMGRELIHNTRRWCLWLTDLDPQDLRASPILKQRIDAVREFRQASRAESTRKMADTPHLFGQRSQPRGPYVGIPRVFSERRLWATVEHLPATTIAGDKVYTAIDPDGFLFSIISSSMFITWQKLVGGRLESRPSFSNTVVWNNLPLPEVSEELREEIIEAGKEILAARELYPDKSLADHYDPLKMDSSLVAAHNNLDRYVDKAFGAVRALRTNAERQEILLLRYQEMTAEFDPDGT